MLDSTNFRIAAFPWPNTAEVVSQPPHAWINSWFSLTWLSRLDATFFILIIFKSFLMHFLASWRKNRSPMVWSHIWTNITRTSVSSATTVANFLSQATLIPFTVIVLSASPSCYILPTHDLSLSVSMSMLCSMLFCCYCLKKTQIVCNWLHFLVWTQCWFEHNFVFVIFDRWFVAIKDNMHMISVLNIYLQYCSLIF